MIPFSALCVRIGDHFFGINIEIVSRVLVDFQTTQTLNAPNFLEGITFFSKELIPVIKLKRLIRDQYFDFLTEDRSVIVIKNEEFNQLVGIVVDEVLGVENVAECLPLEDSLNSLMDRYVIGQHQKEDGKRIFLFNILEFLFDRGGFFRYRHLIKDEKIQNQELSTNVLNKIEDHLDIIDFPFNKMTFESIKKHLIKIAYIQNLSVEKLLEEDQSLFKSHHFVINPPASVMFENFPDMYVLSDLIKDLLLSQKKISIALQGRNSLYNGLSIAMMIFLIQRLIHIEIDIITTEQEQVLSSDRLQVSSEALKNINHYDQKRFFNYEGDQYWVKSDLQYQIHYQSHFKEHVNHYDIIYAPNILLSYNENDLMSHLSDISQSMSKRGVLLLGLFEDVSSYTDQFKKVVFKGRQVFFKEI